MKFCLSVLGCALLASVACSGVAVAQSLSEQGVVGGLGMGALYGATKSVGKSDVEPDILQALEQMGYTNISPVASTPSQYTAFHPSQGPVLLTVNEATGKLVSAVPR